MQPKISLLMASYNNAKYIKEAIDSVLKQSSPDWELIIVDDVSTDDSLEILKPYLKDKRIKLIKHKKNEGYGAALKTAVENSSGQILGRIDSDDALHKDAVKIMLKNHKKFVDFGLIYSTFYECNNYLKIKGISKWVGKIKKNKTNLQTSKISHFETFKKSTYLKTQGFDPKQKKAVDKDIFYKLEEVTKTKFIDKPLYCYRVHDKGISQGNNFREAYGYFVLAKYKAYKRRLRTNIPNLTKEEITNQLLEVANNYIENKQMKKARLFLLKAIKLNPTNMNFIKKYLGTFI